MKFKIVTPERVLMDIEVESVSVPTQTGEITILNNHIPLVSNLAPGELRLVQNGETKFFAVSGGFVEVRDNNEVIVLADTAELDKDIDIARAEQAREEALKAMSDNYSDDKTTAEAMAKLEKNLARIKVIRKRRTHTTTNLESGVLHTN